MKAIGSLVAMGIMSAAMGQGSPPGCNGASSGALFKIFIDDAPSAQTDCVQAGEKLSYQITLQTGPPIDVDNDGIFDFISCDNVGGSMILTFPDGDQIALDGEADLPQWGFGANAINITIGGYVADVADAVDGFLTAQLHYCCWTVLSDPPVLSDKTIELTISICLISQGLCCDTNGDDVIDVEDLVNAIMQWGEPGSADVDGDGIVSITDIKCIILSWGPC